MKNKKPIPQQHTFDCNCDECLLEAYERLENLTLTDEDTNDFEK